MPGPLRQLSASARRVSDRFGARTPGLGPPGVNPLFIAVLAALGLAVAVGARAGDHQILESRLVYRLVLGGVTFAILYGVIAVLWLAWHRRLLKRLSIAGASGEVPGQETAREISKRDVEIEEFMATTASALEELDTRLISLEERVKRA